MLNVYINGLSGKMGQTILHLCDTDHDLNVVTTKNLEKIDVVIDFSRPESTLNLLKEFEDHKVPFIIGTTGFTSAQSSIIEKTAYNFPILLAFNVSRGIFTLKNSIKKFLKENKEELKCSIEEIHHISKIDSPSGTAIELENYIKISDLEERIVSININSKRVGDVYGIHKVCFSNDSNVIEFKHEALSRNVFAEGAIEIAKEISKKDPGLYQVEDFFDDK